MNSLSFLSRQFDVLASTNSRSSSPAPQDIRALGHSRSSSDHASLKRVQTWSTKSFLFPQPPHATYPTSKPAPRRTASSPADFVDLPLLYPSTSSSSSLAPPVQSSIPVPAPEVVTMQPRSRRSRFQAAFRRIFFIQVFVLLWDAFYAGWTSLTARAPLPTRRQSTPSDDDSSTTSDEDQKEPIIRPRTSLPIPQVPTVTRYFTDPPATLEHTTASSQSRPYHSLIPRHDVPFSRASTPSSGAARAPRGVDIPKTLVLDLDETLIHSTSRPMPMSSSWNLRSLFNFGKRNKGTGHTVEVILGGKRTLYHVYKRPFVDFFLRTVRGGFSFISDRARSCMLTSCARC
jgi:hypothetical protein